jgi:hypothetical protein
VDVIVGEQDRLAANRIHGGVVGVALPRAALVKVARLQVRQVGGQGHGLGVVRRTVVDDQELNAPAGRNLRPGEMVERTLEVGAPVPRGDNDGDVEVRFSAE